MSYSPPRCSEPGCRTIAIYQQTYCGVHQPDQRKAGACEEMLRWLTDLGGTALKEYGDFPTLSDIGRANAFACGARAKENARLNEVIVRLQEAQDRSQERERIAYDERDAARVQLAAATLNLHPVGEEESALRPLCRICQKPAVCFGSYETNANYAFSCDACCGHGNEDGYCTEDFSTIGSQLNEAIEESDALHDKLATLVAAAEAAHGWVGASPVRTPEAMRLVDDLRTNLAKAIEASRG